MNSNSFEKPKDWNIAPSTSWVSGTPIGEVRMPDLGDPGSHENASERVSFGDDAPEVADTPSLWQGKMVKQCPAGTSSQGGVCMTDPESKAKPESKAEVNKRQFDREAVQGDGGKGSQVDSFKREMPKAPGTDPQIRRLVKEGYKGRNK
jgi:hypothetical protein